MALKAFLDANVILDFILRRSGYSTASFIFNKGVAGEIELFTTPAILQMVSYWLRKEYAIAETKEIILTLLADLTIIDCDHQTALFAINSSFTDIEDALQYYAALKFNLDCFITEDKKIKRHAIPELPVYNSQEVVKLLQD